MNKMKILEKVLREYQYKALKVCDKYLSSKEKGHALVHLPTGTGKTGIMASICVLNKDKNILIIVPNSILPIQTLNEIKEDFWIKLEREYNKKGNIIFKSSDLGINNLKVELLDNKDKFKDLKNNKGIVYISTMQFLYSNLFDNGNIYKDTMDIVTKNIDYILFDEGHKEPSKNWSKITRKFKLKIILFTATPYRNDSLIFKINSDYIYSKEMKYFIEEKYISDVYFKPLELSYRRSNNILSAKSDISNEKLLEILEKEYKNGKIIIRCSGVKRIEEIVDYINSNSSKVDAVGFHSKIKNDKHFFKEGKNITENITYDIFVHSNALIEGLDIDEIKTIIFLDTFSNFKTTIQQIGRALRNSNVKANIYMPAVVIKDYEKQWENLLNYKYINTLKEQKYIYESNRLKKRFTNESKKGEIEKNMVVPMKANIFFSKKDIWNDLIEEVNKALNQDDFHNVIYDNINDAKSNSRNCIVYYEDFTYSKYLNHIGYENRNLQILLLTKVESQVNEGVYYFYYNSKNKNAFEKDRLYDSLSSKFVDLNKLITDSFEIKKASYEKTTPLIESGIRVNEVVGKRIEGTDASLEQKLSFNKNILAKDNNENITRYINTITSRVSDNKFGTMEDYLEWNKSIIDKIESESRVNKFLGRFAKISTVAPKSRPTYIYGEFKNIYTVDDEDVDIGEFSAEFLNGDDSDDFKGENKKGRDSNEFEIEIGELKENFEIEFNESSRKYKVKKSKNTNKAIELINEDETITLLDAINKSSFVIYFLKDKLIYTEGRYYEPNINTSFEKPDDWNIWENIEIIDKLKCCNSEKGKKKDDKYIKESGNWPKKSVFRQTIDYIKTNKKNIDYLVCDDMGTEIADFIGISLKSKKIFYIHCKHNGSNLSASSFQDLCGQANKNMRYVINRTQEDNKYFENRKNKWEKKWPLYGKEAEGGYIDRYILGGDAEDIHGKLKCMMSAPDTKYEIWLVNSGLSYRSLENEITKKKENQKEEVAQIVWLLQSTQDYFSQVNTTVKVFCKP